MAPLLLPSAFCLLFTFYHGSRVTMRNSLVSFCGLARRIHRLISHFRTTFAEIEAMQASKPIRTPGKRKSLENDEEHQEHGGRGAAGGKRSRVDDLDVGNGEGSDDGHSHGASSSRRGSGGSNGSPKGTKSVKGGAPLRAHTNGVYHKGHGELGNGKGKEKESGHSPQQAKQGMHDIFMDQLKLKERKAEIGQTYAAVAWFAS